MDENQCTYRIGFGYDAHEFINCGKLILGGIEIPYNKGLKGHSDADVLCHAIVDSILGACALGDIGRLFPDTEKKYKGISSLFFLEKTKEEITKSGYIINNIDCTITAQEPKLMYYEDEMKSNISKSLNIDIGCISIKATTCNRLGFVGRVEGIGTYAVALVRKL
jgi:2-C-methyl-D-erythritol 2,4-cyclodiphosphate synthase